MKLNESYRLFFGNYFCILKERQAAFVCISKNACTFLKSVATVSAMQDYEHSCGPLLKFAVWRDPVQRLLSVYVWFIVEKNRNRYFQWLDLYADNDFDRFLEFVSFELGKSAPENQDEHIRHQCDYYEGGQVDVIVPLDRLCSFLACNQLPVLRKQNQSGSRNFLITEKQRETIRTLYARDYQFFIAHRHLLFED